MEELSYNPLIITNKFIYDITQRKKILALDISPDYIFMEILDANTILCKFKKKGWSLEEYRQNIAFILVDILSGEIIQKLKIGDIRVDTLPNKNYQSFDREEIPTFYFNEEKNVSYVIFSDHNLCSIYEYKDRKLMLYHTINQETYETIGDKYLSFNDYSGAKYYIYDITTFQVIAVLKSMDQFFGNKLISVENGKIKIYDIDRLSFIKQYNTVDMGEEFDNLITVKHKEKDNFYLFMIKSQEFIYFDSFENKTFALSNEKVSEYRKRKKFTKIYHMKYIGGNNILLLSGEDEEEEENESLILNFVDRKVIKFEISNNDIILISKNSSLLLEDEKLSLLNLNTLEKEDLEIITSAKREEILLNHHVMPFRLDIQKKQMQFKVDKLFENYISKNVKDIISKFI